MSSSSALLTVRGLNAAWEGVPVLRGISFEVADGELLALMGPNGSGKTTLLRCLAGLEPTTAGTVLLGGIDITRRPAHRRSIGLMFQDPALFPHRTVFENIAYAPLLQKRPRGEVEHEVEEFIGLLRLSGFEDRFPDQLSGGERQRVALARTLAARPRLVLLDEPFASIDVELKAELRAEFRHVLRTLGIAAVHVTHDREEGLFLGDRVALLFDGVLAPPGTPSDVFLHPPDARSARFLGYNVIADGSEFEAVLPQDVRFVMPSAGRRNGQIVASGTTGRDALTVVRLESGERVEARAPTVSAGYALGSAVGVDWERSARFSAERPDPAKEPKNQRILSRV